METSRWDPVKDLMAGAAPVTLGPMHAYHMARSPRRILYTLSYYKFAAKMIGRGQESGDRSQGSEGQGRRVLDVGCGEGLGTWLLASECGYAKGVDFDGDLIATARQNWPAGKADFECADVLAMPPGEYDAAVSFDVIEHILPDNAAGFVQAIARNLKPHGIAVIGTPNLTSKPYASAVTNAGHVNLYDADRLEAQMREHFRHVFMFGANDEVVHTGFAPMAQYLIALACAPRAGMGA